MINNRYLKASIAIFFVTSLLLINTISAFADTGDSPVIRAVLFYSPTCPHCHKVITEDLPPLFEKYGDRLEIIGIDVSQEGGQNLYQAAVVTYKIPDERLGVPTLIVGNVVLVGDQEIPEKFPIIIENGLKNNGIDWPDIPGLEIALAEINQQEASNGAQEENQSKNQNVTEEPQDSDTVIGKPANPDQNIFTIIQERFLRDKSGNTIAVLTLTSMIAVIAIIAYYYISGKPTHIFSLSSWIIPILSIIGIFIAIYLSYVEVTETIAVCGPVGDCNTVQQSSYATLFGILPIGLLGIAGYIAIFVAWLIFHFNAKNSQKLLAYLIWGMAWFGVLFSIYLTFLEPFIIGATCMWCISSAIVMTIILWVSTGPIITYTAKQYDELSYNEE